MSLEQNDALLAEVRELREKNAHLERELEIRREAAETHRTLLADAISGMEQSTELLTAVRKLREALMMISCRVKLSDTWEYCWCDPETTKDKMHDGQCQMANAALADTAKWEKP